MANHSALDVAAWILAENWKGVAEGWAEDDITVEKLQNLLYYAQGSYLGIAGEPLFEDAIQAAYSGARIPAVADAYDTFAADPIKRIVQDADLAAFSASEDDILFQVLELFDGYTPAKLRNMVRDELPWKKAMDGAEPAAMDPMIIQRFFQDEYVTDEEAAAEA